MDSFYHFIKFLSPINFFLLKIKIEYNFFDFFNKQLLIRKNF